MKPVSIRTHSWYSLLEGVDSPDALAQSAASKGYASVAITDTNSVGGVVKFCEACHRCGVRPIVGARLWHVAKYCTVLVAEPAGYRNLCSVISRCSLDEKSDLFDVLAASNEGLHVLVDDPKAIRPPLLGSFGKRLWAEVVRPARSAQHEASLIEAATKFDVPPVASLGARMAGPEGYGTYRLVAALRQGATLSEQAAILNVRREHHLAEAADYRDRFSDLPGALGNAVSLADRCRSDVLPRGPAALPVKLPHGVEPLKHLAKVCDGALTRLNLATKPAVRRRLEEELSLIGSLGLAGYFLLCGEVAEEAARQSWPMNLRGSAGSSLVCHLLGLTPTDPVGEGLRIERFLNAGRDRPDVDIEFATQQRRLALSWMLKKYGDDHVARVGVYAHLREASSLRAALKLHGLAADQIDAVREPLGELEDLSDERLREAPSEWPGDADGWLKVLAAAQALQGRPERLQVHGSSIALAADPVGSLAPLTPWAESKRVHVTQLDSDACAAVGLSTLDLLTCRSLGTLADGRGMELELSPQGHESGRDVASLMAGGDAIGLPQVEAPVTRRVLMQVRPASERELADGLALSRPGALPSLETYLRRRHGVEPVRYVHEKTEPALRDTLGCLLYEDDAITLIEGLAGVNGTEADRLRRLFADDDGAAQATTELISACSRVGVSEQTARAVAGGLRDLKKYHFCKAHAMAMARVVWGLASLRVRCPVGFWCAALNNHEGRFATWVYVECAKGDRVAVSPPCVNRSATTWTQEVSTLRAGLNCVRGLDKTAASAVLEVRAKEGPYRSFDEAKRRLENLVTPHSLAALVRSGAFDFAGKGREVLLSSAGLSDRGLPCEARKQPPPIPTWPLAALGTPETDEWEMLGFSCGPPIMALARRELPCELNDSRALRVAQHKAKLRLAGLVAACEGDSLVLFDEFGAFDVDLPPGGERPAEGELVLAEGTVDVRHKAAVLKAPRVEAWHPGLLRMPDREAA